MIDPELKYCIKCNDEYRIEIVKCASCGIDLVSGADLLAAKEQQSVGRKNRLGPLTAQDELVTIHQGSAGELKSFEKLLAAENIGATVVDESQGCGKGCCGSSLNLMVRKEDAADGYHIVQATLDQSRALDDHDLSGCDTIVDMNAGQATCPACGFTFQTSTTTCPDCGLCFG